VTLGPWLVWVPLLALVNLFIFLAIRGRWGRIVWILALASVLGVVIGDLVGGAIGVELLRIGDMHVLAASLLSALGPVRVEG
jgi:hypothetical protein